MALERVLRILSENNIDKDSEIGKNLIQKYQSELDKRTKFLEELELKIILQAEEDFLSSLKN